MPNEGRQGMPGLFQVKKMTYVGGFKRLFSMNYALICML